MRKNYKLLILVLALAVSTGTYAQSFGVQAGFNLSTMSFKYGGDKDNDTKMTPGFNIGGIGEMALSDMFSIQAGLLLDMKGVKFKDDDYTTTTNLFYIDIPILAKARYELSDLNIYGVLGPYFGFGLSGKTKYKDDDDSESESIKWGSGDDDDLKRFDVGMTIGAGVEISAFQFGLSYNLGFANIAANGDSDNQAKNRGLRITAGYWFGK